MDLRPFQQNSSHLWTMATDNEMLCAMEPPFTVEKISPRAGIELGTARSVGQRLTHLATGAPNFSL